MAVPRSTDLLLGNGPNQNQWEEGQFVLVGEGEVFLLCVSDFEPVTGDSDTNFLMLRV